MQVPTSARSLADADDRSLAGRAADGDVRAFEVLVRRYGSLLRTYASRVLGSNDEVDDVVQETFITAWERLPTLESPAAVRGWLIQITTRKSIDRVRARSRRNLTNIDDQVVEAPLAEAPHAVIEAASRTEALSKILSALPEDQRRCWILREVGQYSYDDIAGQLDVPVSTVRGLLARARKRLAVEMEVWK